MQTKELSKQYDPKQVEDRIYDFWLQGGYFHAEPNTNKTPYTIIMPPPNITGQLHMGHAMDNTMQDILIRWRRLQGYEALWMPGTDHASIATEVKIIEAMKEEGLTKEEVGRDGFLERAWQWKATYGGRIVEQLKKLGSSCDWERERFTMDEGCSKAVKEAFVRMYEKDLIYRGERMINWCPDCCTSISDAEVEHEEAEGNFWHIQYPLVDGSGFLEIATTRPETMLGDTAIAVNPQDDRYKNLVGKMVMLPLLNKEIPVITDDYVEVDFGTGAVKITPAHDPNDFEVGERHNLPIINIMNDDASINENGGKYEGLSREQARKTIVEDLKEQGFLIKVADHVHNVGRCYRCGTVVEPRVSLQWFVKMQPLAEPAIKVVENKEIKIIPERFEKVYFNWMYNIRDWTISRQLWWGHRIPAWYCDECKEIVVARTTPDVCPSCGSTRLTQDEDVLDTWFSSALWPFSTLGWPEKTPELDFFYPTNTLVTAYDILFFWVARMIFSGLEHMDEIPFDTVLFHGLVRDEHGKKMSKSSGNGIDPIEVIEEFGADALRFMLSTGVSPGNDTRYIQDKVIAARNFANKIWNATRYVLMNVEDVINTEKLPENLALEDKWVLHLYNNLTKEITEHLENYEFGLATSKLYEFIWDILCDWYIEITKSRIQQGGETSENAQKVLVYLLKNTLTLLHPFMPFITEELWKALPGSGESIVVGKWPEFSEDFVFTKEKDDFQIILDAIRAIRVTRSEMDVPPSKKANVYIETENPGVFSQGVPFIQRLASAADVVITDKVIIADAVQTVTSAARIFLPLDQLVDKEKELERLSRELGKIDTEIEKVNKKLNNPSFTSKAPDNIIQKEQAKLKEAQEIKDKILEGMAALK